MHVRYDKDVKWNRKYKIYFTHAKKRKQFDDNRHGKNIKKAKWRREIDYKHLYIYIWEYDVNIFFALVFIHKLCLFINVCLLIHDDVVTPLVLDMQNRSSQSRWASFFGNRLVSLDRGLAGFLHASLSGCFLMQSKKA